MFAQRFDPFRPEYGPHFEEIYRPMRGDCPVAHTAELGLPATVAPIDRSPSGLPVGVQIIEPYLGDRTTIMLAELLEREFGGFIPPW
jgi:Asp-tRNA(Asn)/Glu-tRNA(Gln) amidotransferase A subunit family amidase